MSQNNQARSEDALRPTPVVTNFLIRREGGAESICLVRRSQRVGSYNARWGGISGFIEKNVTPEEQAFTEIREETSLQADQVRLLRRGQVVEYTDESLHRLWLVHPFLFEVLTPEAIKLDWEAEEMRWVVPDDLSSYETVPRLYEAWLSASQGEIVV